MKNLRLLAAESLSPLVVGLFSFPRWAGMRKGSIPLALLLVIINRGVRFPFE